MNNFNVATPGRIGVVAYDVDASIPKESRIEVDHVGVNVLPETVEGKADWRAHKPSDTLNFFALETVRTGLNILPRGGWGSWSNCVPMIKEVKGWRPLADIGISDKDYVYQHPTIYGVTNVPIGAVALVTATTGHGTRKLVGVLASAGGGQSPIVSDWRSIKPPDYSTHISDMSGATIDPDRHAGFHTFTKIQRWVDPCAKYAAKDNRYVVALNGDTAADKVGLLYTTFAGADALMSYQGGGPLRPSTSVHEVGLTPDASIRQGAIDCEALYTFGTPGFDMPLPFEEHTEGRPVYNGFEVRVKLWRNTKVKHQALCGKKPNRWDLHTRIPVTETPLCTPTKVPNKDSTGTPARTYPVANAVYNPGFTMNQGTVFVPRPGILFGKWPRP